MKICYKLFFKYLVVEDVVTGIEVELKAGSWAKLETKSLFNSSIVLLSGKETWKIAFNKIKGATKARFLQEQLRL